MKIVGMDGLLKELPCGTALLAARAHHREDPFVPLAASLRTAAPRRPRIDHEKVDCPDGHGGQASGFGFWVKITAVFIPTTVV